MKPTTLEGMHDDCLAKGYLHELTRVSRLKVETLLENALTNVNAARLLAAQLENDAREWMNVFILHYDALHLCAEALVHLQRLSSDNHCCLFTALVRNSADLELDWSFLERLRLKRNAIQYEGSRMTYTDWKAIELQTTLYLSTLRRAIEQRLADAKR